jgi:hypothetical protein
VIDIFDYDHKFYFNSNHEHGFNYFSNNDSDGEQILYERISVDDDIDIDIVTFNRFILHPG